MSIDRCVICDALLDTDTFPEVYREDCDDDCICDSCYERREEDEELPPSDVDIAAARADLLNDEEKINGTPL